MAPDRVSLQDYARPYASIVQASEVLRVTIPRHLSRTSGRIYRQMLMFSWSLDSPQGRKLAGALHILWRDLAGIPPQDAASVGDQFLALLNGILDRELGDSPHSDSALDNSLGLVPREYLIANLVRPDLSVEHPVERFQCSRATLHRLFKALSAGHPTAERLV